MRLFHVSEEPGIATFAPRVIDGKSLVWAITEKCLPNYLTPRDCPRVAYHVSEKTTQEDIATFFSSPSRHCVAIEHGWYEQMAKTRLYVYEFDATNFVLLDACAVYYVSEKTETPVSVVKTNGLFNELFQRNVEVRLLSHLWDLGRAVQQSSLNWSLCRMRNAAPNGV